MNGPCLDDVPAQEQRSVSIVVSDPLASSIVVFVGDDSVGRTQLWSISQHHGQLSEW